MSTTNMTNFCELTMSNDDDPTTTSCHDDGDTSFEIDEPEDEEIIDDVHIVNKHINDTVSVTLRSITDVVVSHCSHRNADVTALTTSLDTSYAPCKLCHNNNVRSYTAPHVAIKDDDPDGTQSDSSASSSTSASSTLSHTASSTPTTADVADVAASVVASPYIHKIKRLSSVLHRQQHHQLCSPKTAEPQNFQLNVTAGVGVAVASSSIADDNLSCSIATTTTDIDVLDNIASSSSNNNNNNNNDAPHPAAALRQNDLVMHNKTADASNPGHVRALSSSSYRSCISLHPSQHHPSLPSVQPLQPSLRIYDWIRWICINFKSSGIGEPSVYHALVVIFLEFFAWGLLTMPVIQVLNQTFPDHTFLMNGLVMGIKGILSFLSAPLIGALSDIWGRKFFLLITVFFTCAPIPLMTINTWWFFAMISISGVFAVTFSVVFAYVADVTTIEERSRAYGLVSATFAASLVISPALGAVLMEMYSDTLVVALATAIAVLDVFFILVAVPESLPEKVRPSSWGAPISWEQADPFAALRKVGTDHTILMQCVTVLLSYLPEAGQYSCIFVYLKLKMGFNAMEVAIFIAVVGILSISVQVTLGYLMRALGAKNTIILGLILEMFQLLWYGFGSQAWMMWAAGILAALGSITYPAISAFVSIHSTADRQGAVQGMVTGMRGLCNGLGPAMFGVIFYLFNVDLNAEQISIVGANPEHKPESTAKYAQLIPGPPFVFGALMVILAILVAIYIPESHSEINLSRAPSEKKRVSVDVQYEIESGQKSTSPLSPLMRSDSLAQL